MTMVMTQVYLDANQKKSLALKAKREGTTLSELLRDAGDAALLGISSGELRQLDAATRRAEADLAEITRVLDADAKAHKAFMAAIRKARAAK